MKNGHRQSLTEISIVGITLPGGKKSSSEKSETKKEESSSDLSNNTVAELREMAKEKGVEGYSSMKKAELIAALS